MSSKRRYIENLSWTLSEQLLRLFLGFFVSVWVLRYLGPEDFGIYSYVTAFLFMFSTIARVGLDNILVQEVVVKPESASYSVNTIFTIKLLAGVLCFIMLAVSLQWFNHPASVNQLILIAGLGLFFQAFDVINLYHQAVVNIKPIAIARTGQLLIVSICKILLIVTGQNLSSFVVLIAIELGLAAILFSYVYHRQNGVTLAWKFDIRELERYWELGWPVILSSIAMVGYIKMDQIMIFNMLGENSLGFYAAASKISEAWYFIPFAVTSTLFPGILRFKQEDQALYEQKLQGLFSLLVSIGLIVALVISLYAEEIISILYGDIYFDSISVLTVHIWVGLFIGLGNAASRWFIFEGLQRFFIIRTLVGLVSNFLMNLILIPHFGILGAAMSSLVAVIMANIISLSVNQRLRPLFLLTIRSFNLLNMIKVLK